jgi:hypothetical protein
VTRWALGLAVFAVAATSAAPAASAAPSAGASCPAEWSDVFTSDGAAFVECLGGSWQPVAEPFAPGDRWASFPGPGLTLSGQGRRNPQILSGQWTATPMDAGRVCSVEQAAVTDAGVAAPTVATGQPGEVSTFEVVPAVFTITLSGPCLWQRVG